MAKFQRIFEGGETGKLFKNISCPHDYVSDIFNADDLKLPELDKITDIPFFDRDGNLVTEPGYHENSRTYYRPTRDLVLPPVPLQPTRDDVERAKNLLLNDAFVNFPLVGDYSKAHTLAMVMQTAARELIRGPTPFYLVDKTGRARDRW